MPKQTRETRKESHTCIHETTKFMFVFPEVFQQISHSANTKQYC